MSILFKDYIVSGLNNIVEEIIVEYNNISVKRETS